MDSLILTSGPSFCCPGIPGSETADRFGLAARGPVIADNNGDPWENWAQLEALHFFLLEHSSWETGVVQDFANQDEIADNLGWPVHQLRKSLAVLRDLGEIEVQRRTHNRYRLRLPTLIFAPGILDRQEGIMSSLASTGHEYGYLPRLPREEDGRYPEQQGPRERNLRRHNDQPTPTGRTGTRTHQAPDTQK